MRHELILQAIDRTSRTPRVVLDIGSGQGDFLKKASTHFAATTKLIGIELSDTGISRSREKVPTASFYQADIFNPPQELAAYSSCADVAVCSDVLEHVDDPAEFLRRICTYLVPDGTLIVTVPGGPMSAFDRHIGHRTHFDARSIRQVVQASGLRVEKVQQAGFPFFNLYRLVVILRGARLISDVSRDLKATGRKSIALLTMRLFRLLFRMNIANSPFGWQILVIVKKDCP
jgi:SAM-dependent methyltransferase